MSREYSARIQSPVSAQIVKNRGSFQTKRRQLLEDFLVKISFTPGSGHRKTLSLPLPFLVVPPSKAWRVGVFSPTQADRAALVQSTPGGGRRQVANALPSTGWSGHSQPALTPTRLNVADRIGRRVGRHGRPVLRDASRRRPPARAHVPDGRWRAGGGRAGAPPGAAGARAPDHSRQASTCRPAPHCLPLHFLVCCPLPSSALQRRRPPQAPRSPPTAPASTTLQWPRSWSRRPETSLLPAPRRRPMQVAFARTKR